MTRSLAILAALAAVLAAPAAASADAVCTLSFEVRFERSGEIVQTAPGAGNCVGSLGAATVDPGAVPAARVSGLARPGLTSCTPVLRRGRLALELWRFMSFSPRPELEVSTSWKSTATDGVSLLADRARTRQLAGSAVFLPAAPCTAGGFGPGTLRMDVVLS